MWIQTVLSCMPLELIIVGFINFYKFQNHLSIATTVLKDNYANYQTVNFCYGPFAFYNFFLIALITFFRAIIYYFSSNTKARFLC